VDARTSIPQWARRLDCVAMVLVFAAASGCERDPVTETATDWREVRRQFVANQDRANKQLKGKHVEWTGTLSSAAHHLEKKGGLFAVLYPEDKKDTAFLAWFEDDLHDEVFAVRPGQVVTVSCRIDHISTKFLEVAISLESCRLVNVKPLSPAASADDLSTTQTISVPDRAARPPR
jgi:hypothetical protein